jgi:ABC-2 type transport system permease protein
MNFRAIGASFRQQAIQFVTDPQWIIPSIISPFLFTMVVLMIYPDVTGPVVLQAVLGGGVLGMWGNTLFASSYTISFDRMNGTLEPLIASPTNLVDVIIGRAIWNALIGLLNALLVFVIAELIFRTDVTVVDPLMFFLTLILTLLSLASIGLIFSAAFVFSRRSYVLTSIAEYPIYILCGALVPITMLPGWTNYISLALAPTWGVEAMKMAAVEGYQSTLGFDMWICIAAMLILTAVCLVIASLLLRRIERNILETGSATRY